MNRNFQARSQNWLQPLCLAALLGGAGVCHAQGIGVTVNGDPVRFAGVGPQQIEGRVLVPVRGVLERLGANIAWVPQTQTVIASNARVDIQLIIGQRNATVNGKNVTLDVPAQMIGGSTMVPLRFIGEALGIEVGWNNATRTVQIVTNGTLPDNPRDNPREHDNNNDRGNHAGSGNRNPVIDRITHNANGWLTAGGALRVAMEGTPGGQASFRIPGLIDSVPMVERSPGRYEGTWQAPAGKAAHLADAAVIGSLKIGNREAPLLQSGQPISIDASPPRVRDRSPEPDSQVTQARPNIYAVFEDQGSGIDPKGTRLFLNGRDVTGEANVTRDFITYTPQRLDAGVQTVQIRVADKAGNKSLVTWKFTEGRQEAGGIRSVKTDAADTLTPGDVVKVRVAGTPNSKVTFNIGTAVRGIGMREVSAGNYEGQYTIRRGDDITGGRVRSVLVAPDGQRYTADDSRAVQVTTGKPSKPVLVSPGANEQPANPLVIRGKGTPNTKVHVKVGYRNKVLGAFALQGTAADVTVDVDKNGNWQTEPLKLNGLFSSRNVEYTITATGVNAADEESEPTELTFKLR